MNKAAPILLETAFAKLGCISYPKFAMLMQRYLPISRFINRIQKIRYKDLILETIWQYANSRKM